MSRNEEDLGDRGGPWTEVQRFERRLAHPPDKVWRALTDSLELARWFPARIDGERAKGAALRFVFPDGADVGGTIAEFDPPRLLVYTMGDETLRWELAATPQGGCLLVFTAEVKVPCAPANENGGAFRARLAA